MQMVVGLLALVSIVGMLVSIIGDVLGEGPERVGDSPTGESRESGC